MTSENENKVITGAVSPDLKNLTTLPDKIGALPSLGGSSETVSTGAGASSSSSSGTVSTTPAPVTGTPVSNAAIPGAVKPLAGNYKMTSDFGMRMHPVKKVNKLHKGVDLAGVKRGSAVSSVLPGTVEFAGEQNGYGKIVIVKHPDGTRTAYAHLDSMNVQKGQTVTAGSNLGGMGSSGVGTGAHLHFEYRDANGKPMDPKRFV